jgi:cytochrome c heme-lyase
MGRKDLPIQVQVSFLIQIKRRMKLITSAEPPFDRHDWIVTRPVPDAPKDSPAPTTTTRYVIDYYSAPEDEEGNPVFILDVRPALDDFASLAQRVKMGWEDWKTGEHENQ